MIGARKPEKTFEVPEKGTHMARLMGIVDLGHQPGYEYRGKPIPSSWKIQFIYELVATERSDGTPFIVSEEMKNNSWEGNGKRSNLMARTRAIDPKNESEDAANFAALLGKPCMVTVDINEAGYAKVSGQAAVSGVPMGLETPPLLNEPFIFAFSDDEVTGEPTEPDMETWEKLGSLTKDNIQRALNYPTTKLAQIILTGEHSGEY